MKWFIPAFFDVILLTLLVILGKFDTSIISKYFSKKAFFQSYLFPLSFSLLFIWRTFLRYKTFGKEKIPISYFIISFLPAINILLVVLVGSEHKWVLQRFQSDYQTIFFYISQFLGFVEIVSLLHHQWLFKNGRKEIRRPMPTNIYLKFFVSLLLFYISYSYLAKIVYRTTGDEPHYLLMVESLLNDGDLNLLNNYHRRDYSNFYFGTLTPQPADLVNNTSIYSYHSPFLPMLLVPGYRFACRLGAIWTMNFFTSLLFTLLLFLANQWFDNTKNLLVIAFLAITYPFNIYSFEIFPEIPGALFTIIVFILILYLQKSNSFKKRILLSILSTIMLILLSLLKVGYVPISFALLLYVLFVFIRNKRIETFIYISAGVLLFLLGTMFLFSEDFLSLSFLHRYVHLFKDYFKILTRWDLTSFSALFGILFDQEYGLLFYAPIYFFAFILAISTDFLKNSKMTKLDRFFIYIVPAIYYFAIVKHKSFTWHGGWAPPLRFIIVILPLIGLFSISIYYTKNLWIKGFVLFSIFFGIIVSDILFIFPDIAYNNLDGTSQFLNFIGKFFKINLASYFPSFVRPNTPVLFLFIFIFIIIAISARNRQIIDLEKNNEYVPLVKEFFNGQVLANLTIILLCIAIVLSAIPFYPTFHLEAEDRLDLKYINGYFYPMKKWAEHQRTPLFRCGRILNQNASIGFRIFTITQKNLVRVWAKSSKAANQWSMMSVLIDGNVIGRTFVISDQRKPFPHAYKKIAKKLEKEKSESSIYWMPFDFPFSLPSGQHTIEISFINDFYDIQTKEDRNLIIDSIQIMPCFLSYKSKNKYLNLFPSFLYGNEW